jgi:hypothetical protein
MRSRKTNGLSRRASPTHFTCELRDHVGQGRHCQWFDHTATRTSPRILDSARPDPAVATGRSADDGERLVMQCAGTPLTRQPVLRYAPSKEFARGNS